MTKVNAILLAAGRSERMGRPKALLKINNQTFAENLTLTFAQIAEKICLIINPTIFPHLIYLKHIVPKIQLIINNQPQLGRLYSIQLGLKHCAELPVFIHNIDTPLISVSTLKTLVEHYHENKVIVPQYKGKNGHPILVGKRLIPHILSADIQNNLREILKPFDKKTINVNDDKIILNINTQLDFINLINTFTK